VNGRRTDRLARQTGINRDSRRSRSFIRRGRADITRQRPTLVAEMRSLPRGLSAMTSVPATRTAGSDGGIPSGWPVTALRRGVRPDGPAHAGEIRERERTGTLRRRERRVGRFEHVVTLPSDVDPNKVDANLSGGVLTVRAGKARGQPGPPHRGQERLVHPPS
jgi:hypothetical protein